MTGPLAGNGRMIGAVYFARTWATPAFNGHNLAELGAVCAHLSAQLAAFKTSYGINPTAH